MSTPEEPRPETVKRRRRLKGQERRDIARRLAEDYEGGSTIRGLAAAGDLSYGLVHALLTEEKVRFRTRGGRLTR